MRPDHAFRRAVAGATETAEALLEAEILEPEALELIRRELEELAAQPSAERSWEALDTMEERLASRVQEAADALAWAMEATDALAESPADEGRRKELDAALARLAKTGAAGELPPELARALRRTAGGEGGLPSDPEALRRTLRTLSNHLESRARKTCASSSGCKGPGSQKALADLADYVDARLQASPHPGQSLYLTPEMEAVLYGEGRDGDGRPGVGAISRGRGDAPMLWGTPVDPGGAGFAPRDLPPGFADPESSQTLAVLMGAPPEPGEIEPGAPSGAAAREGVGEASGARKLSPARREVVRRYFGARPSAARLSSPKSGRERAKKPPEGD